MSQTAVKSNKLALISFSAVLVMFLILVDVFMIVEERNFLVKTEKRNAEEELDIMGKFLTEAMIRNDYVAVEQYIPQWAQARPDVVKIRVIAPNGFVIAQHRHEPASKYIYELNKPIVYFGKLVLTLEIQWDFVSIHDFLRKRTATLISLSIVAVIVLGMLLWQVLKKTAIVPLQREIEERKKIESKLEEHTRELAAHADELESYSYSIAHDLRAPVRSITSFSQILLQDLQAKLEPEDRSALLRVISAGKYMAGLIDDILALSRITRDSMKVAPLNLTEMAEDSVTRLREDHPARKCNVEIEANLSAKGDPRLIQLLLDNLLGNAWKYTANKPNASIEFGITSDSHQTFYVRDNGVGFDMQYADKLFQPFQRLHSREEFEGTGVGLATVQRIINRHGGKVWVESKLDQGTTFYFTLGNTTVTEGKS
ncbi:sensor histidine kinase [Kaarinaea lacus]